MQGLARRARVVDAGLLTSVSGVQRLRHEALSHEHSTPV